MFVTLSFLSAAALAGEHAIDTSGSTFEVVVEKGERSEEVVLEAGGKVQRVERRDESEGEEGDEEE